MQAWELAGKALKNSVDHIWVLTLPGRTERQAHMHNLLERHLGVPPHSVTFLEGAAGSSWGNWPYIRALETRRAAQQSQRSDWWLKPLCGNASAALYKKGALAPPPCLQPRYSSCVPTAGVLPRFCNELCYTASVVAALDEFLLSKHETALLLEDDICATNALLNPSGRELLHWMRHQRWDAIKLGDCFRGMASVPAHHQPSTLELLTSGTCATPGQEQRSDHDARTTLLPDIPMGYCTHALAVTRRMAKHLVRHAFPVSDVFDSLFAHHVVRHAHLQEFGLRIHSANLSLFAQIEKAAQQKMTVPKAMRSQNHGKGTHLISKGQFLAT
jgi:hypothetical protein